ncbi:MAG: hypothetical protein AAB801_02575 [Patescibacteria group bacterium]
MKGDKKRKFVPKAALLTEEEINFVNEMQQITGNKFTQELREILDDYIDYVNSDKLKECGECRWNKREEHRKEG